MTTATLTEAQLLALWEAGLGASPLSRALLMAAAAAPRGGPTELADMSVGRRDALLLALRERCFGSRLPCTVTCPRCSDQLEMSLSVADLRVDPEGAGVAGQAEVAGVYATFRAPTSRDLLAVDPAAPGARRRLVSGCIVEARTDEGPLPIEDVDDEVVETVAARLGDVDPQSDLLLALTCSSCGHEWSAPFDVPGFLWAEVDAYARRLLYDVHSLATTYGWSEPEVLAVSPTRRQFYLGVARA